MDAAEAQNIERPVQPGAEKAVGDLDDLIQAVLAALPGTKPWQRQLRTHLASADRHIQVLRLTRTLGRPKEEVEAAMRSLRQSVRAAYAYASSVRADMGTRMAMLLAEELAGKAARAVVQQAEV